MTVKRRPLYWTSAYKTGLGYYRYDCCQYLRHVIRKMDCSTCENKKNSLLKINRGVCCNFLHCHITGFAQTWKSPGICPGKLEFQKCAKSHRIVLEFYKIVIEMSLNFLEGFCKFPLKNKQRCKILLSSFLPQENTMLSVHTCS